MKSSERLLVVLPKPLKERLVAERERTGASFGEIVRRALIAYLDLQEK